MGPAHSVESRATFRRCPKYWSLSASNRQPEELLVYSEHPVTRLFKEAVREKSMHVENRCQLLNVK